MLLKDALRSRAAEGGLDDGRLRLRSIKVSWDESREVCRLTPSFFMHALYLSMELLMETRTMPRLLATADLRSWNKTNSPDD